MSARAVSRRDALKAGGALIVGFSLARNMPALGADAPLGPDQKRIDSWLTIHADNTATLRFGKLELGQGNSTGLLQIAGEELDLDMDQMSVARFETGLTPDQGSTVASNSIRDGGPQIRLAAAEARQALLQLAAVKLNAPVKDLRVSRGIVSVAGAPTRSVRYGALLGDRPFDVAFTGTAPLKPLSEYRLVGTRVPRIDMKAKALGQYQYMHNVRVPGMWHGRVVRPRGQGALGPIAKVLEVDESSVASIPNVRVVRKGNFVGVVAPDEWQAVKAAGLLKVKWDITPTLPGDAKLFDTMRAAKTSDANVAEAGDTKAALAGAAHVASGQFRGPYQMHAPFAPNCAIADVKTDSALVMCSTQIPYGARALAAKVLAFPADKVTLQYFPGAGTFGHSAYDDVLQAAAILSQSVSHPVRVQFMRWDEHGWECYGPAHLAELSAGIDASGNIVAYHYEGWQHGWANVEPSDQFALGSQPTENGIGGAGRVNPRSAGSMYAAPNRLVVSHGLSGLDGYLKGSFLRSPLDFAIAFASEQIIDELAFAARMDPYLFRKKNIQDKSWLGVLDAVAKAAKWTPRNGARVQSGDVLHGRGIGLGTHTTSYGAAVAEITVDKKTGQIRATHMYGALDCGLAINPALVENQISGMLIQACSRMLKEEVTFSETAVTSLDWAGYPILRFEEHPEVTPIVVQRLDQPSTGAGEEVLAAAGAAIANAFFDATGKRLHQFPLTPARVREALA